MAKHARLTLVNNFLHPPVYYYGLQDRVQSDGMVKVDELECLICVKHVMAGRRSVIGLNGQQG